MKRQKRKASVGVFTCPDCDSRWASASDEDDDTAVALKFIQSVLKGGTSEAPCPKCQLLDEFYEAGLCHYDGRPIKKERLLSLLQYAEEELRETGEEGALLAADIIDKEIG